MAVYTGFTVLSFPDQLKHWQVISVQGGTVMAGTRLYLGCTKFALENDNITFICCQKMTLNKAFYSKTCLKRPLKNRQNKDLYDKW